MDMSQFNLELKVETIANIARPEGGYFFLILAWVSVFLYIHDKIT